MSKEFMIARDGQQYGPYSTEDLLKYLKDGTVGLDDLAWSEGMTDWKPLHEIKKSLIAASRVSKASNLSSKLFKRDGTVSEKKVQRAIKVIGGMLLVCFFGPRLIHDFFGVSFSIGENDLEKALKLGVSDRASFQQFKNKGGLNYVSMWKGYQVDDYGLEYNQSDKLASMALKLSNFDCGGHGCGGKLPSFNSLSSALHDECGSTWHNAASNSNLYYTQNGKFTCSIEMGLEGGQDTLINVDMSK